MPCSSCGHENPSRARFSLDCGTPLALRCPRCQADLPVGAKFCLECGASVAPAPPSPEPDAARPGERRQLTVLFCDLVGSTPLAVRVGIHTGPVVIADGGEVFGDAANVAARVQAAAEPDTVVITAATQRLVAGMFVVEDRGPQALKGVREPVTLYRVVQPSGVRSRLDVAAGHLTRLVGRDIELATLVDRWERAQDGEGQTVVVLGEAGVGKSRLVYQLHEHVAAVPHTWLECGATP